MTLYLGIDIASVDRNKPVDWVKAHAAGVRFAFFRGSYRAWSDPTFNREAARARNAGCTVGAYLFPVFGTTVQPSDQIAAFSRAVDLRPFRDFVPVLDVEFPKGVKATGHTRRALLDRIVEFVAELEVSFRAKPMIYTSARVWDGEDDDALNADKELPMATAIELEACPLWLARYPFKTRIEAVGDDAGEKAKVAALAMPPVPKSWGAGNVWVHQYQGDAINFPGFTSTVDLNRFFDVRFGDVGPRVEWVQTKLGRTTMDTAVGTFGVRTDQAVREFQRTYQLGADGVVGPKTFAALSWK